MGESELVHVSGVPQRRLPVGGDARVLLQQLLHPSQAGPLKPCQDQTQQKVAFFINVGHECLASVLGTI